MALRLCLRALWRIITRTSGRAEPVQPTFPDTIENFGYHFDDNGRLVNSDGVGFQFEIDANPDYNRLHYSALGDAIVKYIYNILETDYRLRRVPIPVDAWFGEPQSFFFMSQDALQTDKLVVLIHGSGSVRAGQWSRRLIINEGLWTGSQLEYIQRALGEGWGLVVMNTNHNRCSSSGRQCKFRGSDRPETHGLYVWEHFVRKARAKHIAIVAFSYGGKVTCAMTERFFEDFRERVFCIAYLDSSHDKTCLPTRALRDFMKERALNFAASPHPLSCELVRRSPDDCRVVSAGTGDHDRVCHVAFDSVFQFINTSYASRTMRDRMASRRRVTDG